MASIITQKTRQLTQCAPRWPFVLNPESPFAQNLIFGVAAMPETDRMVDLFNNQGMVVTNNNGGVSHSYDSELCTTVIDFAEDTGADGIRSDRAQFHGDKLPNVGKTTWSAVMWIKDAGNTGFTRIFSYFSNAGFFSAGIEYLFLSAGGIYYRTSLLSGLAASLAPLTLNKMTCVGHRMTALNNHNFYHDAELVGSSSTAVAAYLDVGTAYGIGAFAHATLSNSQFNGSIYCLFFYSDAKPDSFFTYAYDPSSRFDWAYEIGRRTYFLPGLAPKFSKTYLAGKKLSNQLNGITTQPALRGISSLTQLSGEQSSSSLSGVKGSNNVRGKIDD